MLPLRSTFLLLVVTAVGSGLGCPGETPPDPSPEVTLPVEPDPGTPLADMARSTRNDLRWKRYRALEVGLGQALLLDDLEICTELGRFRCVDDVHLVALGGNDPYRQALYEPLGAPGATSPIAVERLALSACTRAVEKETDAAVQFVFLDLDLASDAPLDLDDETTQLAVQDTIVSLYRRLHGRDPTRAERALVEELTSGPAGSALTPRDFATLSCFTIATTSEMVLY